MALRQYPLTTQVDGINLMRSKGGAAATSLFDLQNGWVTSQRTIKARPGSSLSVTFPAGTVGMVAMDGFFHTFSHLQISTGVAANVIVNTLRHPLSGNSAILVKIHEAFPFLGRIYVVAEFADGTVQHYWNENPASWSANTVYQFGSAVQHPTPNGYYYEIKTNSTIAAWQANSEVAVNTVRQPRIANNFKYTVTATTGTAPIRTSNTEPVWPIVDGATIVERRYLTDGQAAPGEPGTTIPTPPPGGQDGGGGGAGGEYGPFPPDEREGGGTLIP